MPENETTEVTETTEVEAGQQFSQADVDKIVRDRLAQQAKNKFGDYDTLKAAAGEKASADERIAELEKRYEAAEAARLRSDIAAQHGVSAEDRDLFLTASDESTLTAQAKRLQAREADRKKQGNVAPREGATTTTGSGDTDMRSAVGQLFGRNE